MSKDIFEPKQLFQDINAKMNGASGETNQECTFNIFKVLGIENKEVLVCRLLGDLLDPCGTHGLKEKPLKLFLKQLQRDFTSDEIENASVVLEDKTNDNRRADIVIFIGNDVIPIEVKIWAGDQKKQLWDYYTYYFDKSEDKKIYYLTPTGHKPSEDSFYRLKTEQYECLSFERNISEWVNSIVPSNNGRIKLVLDQFIEVIKDMCKQEQELQTMMEILGLGKDLSFEANDNIEALLQILEMNQKNDLWGMIRKKYLEKNLKFPTSTYKLFESDSDSEKDKKCIFKIKTIGTEKDIPKEVASICVETNLYIVASQKIKEGTKNQWRDGCWQYLKPQNYKKTSFALNKPTLEIVHYDTDIDITDLLQDIDMEDNKNN